MKSGVLDLSVLGSGSLHNRVSISELGLRQAFRRYQLNIATMEIPQGNTPEDNKARRAIIKDFYSHWMSEHPEKKVWNKSLNAYINVKNNSINEALGHAPRSVEATLAQMHLSEILSDAVYINTRPPKNGDKNQKRFSKMLFLRWGVSRVLVGQRKTSGEYELYYISGGQKKKAVR